MYFQPSDELSAIAAVEAMACQGGRYADNTSSQGLLLKTKNLFSVAGKRLPVVMTVMAREVNKGSLSIHCGHTDFYAVRNAGWAQLVSEDNQELHDLLPVAFKVSELNQVMLPTMVIGDGFIKSHAIENIKELSDAFLEYYVGPPNRMYQPNFEHGTLTGTFTDTDLTMEGQVSQDLAYRFFKRGFVIAMNNMNKILGTNLKVVECYRTEDADMVVVILGSAAGVIKDVVDYYRDVKGYKIGVVRPVLVQPALLRRAGLRHAQGQGDLRPGAGRHRPQPAPPGGRPGLPANLHPGRPGRQERAPHLWPGRHAHPVPRGLRPGQQGLQQVRRRRRGGKHALLLRKEAALPAGFLRGDRRPHDAQAHPPARLPGAGVGHDLYRRGRRRRQDRAGVRGPHLCPGHGHGQEIYPVRGPLRRRPERRPGVHEPAHLLSAHPQQFGIHGTGRPGLLQREVPLGPDPQGVRGRS